MTLLVVGYPEPVRERTCPTSPLLTSLGSLNMWRKNERQSLPLFLSCIVATLLARLIPGVHNLLAKTACAELGKNLLT